MQFKRTCTMDGCIKAHIWPISRGEPPSRAPPPPPPRIWPISRGTTPPPPPLYFQGLQGSQTICYPGPHYGSHRPCVGYRASYVLLLMLLLCMLLALFSGYAQNSPATCEPTSWVPPGFQAILLGAPFQQYGSITAINASMTFSALVFAHAIYLQVWRPVNQSTFTLVRQQYFFADPWVMQLPSTTLMFPTQFRNSPSIQLSFIPNDVLGYYVVTGSANIDQLGYALSLSPILGISSQPASMDVYTSNSSVPLQSISISGSPTYPSVHPYITIAYVTSSPSQSVGGVQRSTITVLGACPVSSSILTPTNSLMPFSLSSSTLQLSSYLLPTTPLLNATPTSPRPESATFAVPVYASLGVITVVLALVLTSAIFAAAVMVVRSKKARQHTETRENVTNQDSALEHRNPIATSEIVAYQVVTNV